MRRTLGYVNVEEARREYVNAANVLKQDFYRAQTPDEAEEVYVEWRHLVDANWEAGVFTTSDEYEGQRQRVELAYDEALKRIAQLPEEPVPSVPSNGDYTYEPATLETERVSDSGGLSWLWYVGGGLALLGLGLLLGGRRS